MPHSYAGVWLCGCLFLFSWPCIFLSLYCPLSWPRSNLTSANFPATAGPLRRSFSLLKGTTHQYVNLQAVQSNLSPYFFHLLVFKRFLSPLCTFLYLNYFNTCTCNKCIAVNTCGPAGYFKRRDNSQI